MTNTRRALPILTLALFAACEAPSAPDQGAGLTTVVAEAPVVMQASGTFTQTAITSLVPSSAGPNTILDQTSMGVLSGTLSGDWTDELRLTMHPNGTFNAQFTITCTCTVGGESGTLTLRPQDRGELVSPTMAEFEGTATIIDATGDLAGLRGVLKIEGTVDVSTGLATYDYSGTIRFAP